MPLTVPQIHSPTCRRVPTGLRFELRHYRKPELLDNQPGKQYISSCLTCHV